LARGFFEVSTPRRSTPIIMWRSPKAKPIR
jgi:hypothetical protein